MVYCMQITTTDIRNKAKMTDSLQKCIFIFFFFTFLRANVQKTEVVLIISNEIGCKNYEIAELSNFKYSVEK